MQYFRKKPRLEHRVSKHKLSLEKSKKSLRFFQLFLYLAFLFTWFKSNFPAWDIIPLSPWPILAILLVVTFFRIGIRIHQSQMLQVRFSKEILFVLILLLVAILVRTPFLAHSNGLINSDDGISALQSKHISEGGPNSIYYYGQGYMGSFPFHIYALAFKIFGYSIFLYVFVYVLFFLAFMVIQYLLFRRIFASKNMALLLIAFYALPLGHLLSMSFYVGANFTIVFFLGSLSIYLSYLVYLEQKDMYIPGIGFLMGLSFWTHPISIAFIICGAIFLVLRFRLCIKKYLVLLVHFLVGVFPVVLYELGANFKSLQYTFTMNRAKDIFWVKTAKIIRNIPVLISMENNFLNVIYLLILLLGVISIVVATVKNRRFLHENIFVVYFFLFLIIYTFSSFQINETKLRYLYPFYFCLPVLLVSAINLLKSKFKYFIMAALFLIIFVVSNARDVGHSLRLTRQADATLKKVVQSMEDTGEKYWAATFWEAVLISAISGEKLECTSYLHFSEGRYVPWRYRLSYFNPTICTNFFFLKEAGGFAVRFKEIMPHIQDNFVTMYEKKDNLLALLEKLQIKTNVIQAENFTLIYKSEVPVLPNAISSPIPTSIPELAHTEIYCEKGFLYLEFNVNQVAQEGGFRLFAEIPGYSRAHRGLALVGVNPKIRLPLPNELSFKINYGLLYNGIKLPETIKSTVYRLKRGESGTVNKKIVYLSGLGMKIQAFDKELNLCEKNLRLQINKIPQAKNKIQISLFSPFDFSNPFWYGRYCQNVRVEMDSEFVTRQDLAFGENILEIDFSAFRPKKQSYILELEFELQAPFHHHRPWCAAAYLDEVKLVK